jgi:transcriptional regulator with XRE-family HTH domain
MKQIKIEFKRRGLTQKRVAIDLKVSLPTLKRWLTGQGIGLNDFEKILDYLNLTLAELVALVPSEAVFFEYTLEQEKYFASNTNSLAFFDELLKKRSPKRIAKQAKLQYSTYLKLLRKLESLGLIDFLPHEKVRLKVKGEPKWRPNGPLSRSFQSAVLNQLSIERHPKNFIGVYQLKPVDLALFEEKLKELRRFLSHSEARCSPGEKTRTLTAAFLRIDRKPDFLRLEP